MKNLLEYLLIYIVDHPEDIAISETQENNSFHYQITVHADDMGKVIGKNGSVIDAIRKIAKVRAVKEGIHAQVSVG